MSEAARAKDMAGMSLEERLSEWRDRAIKAEEQTVALRAALADAIDSMEYVNRVHPDATGWGVRWERIEKARALLSDAEGQPAATYESERAKLVTEVGECCAGGDPLCSAGCLVQKALTSRGVSAPSAAYVRALEVCHAVLSSLYGTAEQRKKAAPLLTGDLTEDALDALKAVEAARR